MNMNNYYSTPDTFLASAIVANGIPISSMYKEEDGRVHFCFSREEQILDRIVTNYWRKTLATDAQTLLFEYKILKQRIANL